MNQNYEITMPAYLVVGCAELLCRASRLLVVIGVACIVGCLWFIGFSSASLLTRAGVLILAGLCASGTAHNWWALREAARLRNAVAAQWIANGGPS